MTTLYVPRIRQLIRNSEGKYVITKERPRGLCCVFSLRKEDGVTQCFFEGESMNHKETRWVPSNSCPESEKFLLEEVGIGDWDSFYIKNDEGEDFLTFFVQGGV